jgi:K+-transporting ATPase A subunit
MLRELSRYQANVANGSRKVPPLVAIAVSTKAGLSALTTSVGPHGFTGILFAYTSRLANNSQSFAGLSVNTPLSIWWRSAIYLH